MVTRLGASQTISRMCCPILSQPTPFITLLCALCKRCRNASIEFSNINIVQECRVAQPSFNQLGVFNEQVLTRAAHARILAAQCSHEYSRLAVVIKLVMNRSLRADGALVQADGGQDGLVEAVF